MMEPVSRSWFPLVRRTIHFKLASPLTPCECAKLLVEKTWYPHSFSLFERKIWAEAQSTNNYRLKTHKNLWWDTSVRTDVNITPYGYAGSMVTGNIRFSLTTFVFLSALSLIFPIGSGVINPLFGILAVVIMINWWLLHLRKRRQVYSLLIQTLDATPIIKRKKPENG